ncbi:MAG: SlyX family protein [Gammaproteobacteria bacterium]|nr:SlyX family protein [Gammaproteobacteria bacterium]MDP2141909.1 SlyX family protein [Gammaproteobacteria bacterium]MDP2347209.1 SlyX family protein [Gammaproteobacteria bacterium]
MTNSISSGMNNDQLLEQLVDMQSQFAFQEDLLRELNDVVARQQLQIDALQRELLLHRDRITHVMDNLPDKSAATALADDRPPHY